MRHFGCASLLATALVCGLGNPGFAAVVVTGAVHFSDLDDGPLDENPTPGVFGVSDTLIVEGTIDCSDAPPLPGHASACAVALVAGGDLILETGGAIVAENNRGGGNGGDVTLQATGDVVLHGPAGSHPGARISTARTTAAHHDVQHAGAIGIQAGGDVTLEAGSSVSAAAAGGAAGAIEIVAGGKVEIGGLLASGPTDLLDADPLADEVLVPASAQQAGGPITVVSGATSGGSGIVVGSTGVVVSQGDKKGAGLVLLQGCGIEVRGLVASLTREDGAAAVKLRSGEGIVVDGSDLGLSVDDPGFQGRLGALRAGGSRGGSLGQRADLFARSDVQVLGPASDPAAPFAVNTSPGTKPHSSGGIVTVLSLEGSLLASGNAFAAGRSLNGDDGGAIDLQAAGDVMLDAAVVSAMGNFGKGAKGSGGDVVVQSYQGDLLWTSGAGDVRPVGDHVPNDRRGSITLSYCGVIDLTGTTFPTVGDPMPPFPEVSQDCSLPGPQLPPGEALPVCNQPPVAADDDFSTDEDTDLTGNVLDDNGHGPDVDPGGDPLTVTEVNGSAADVGNLVVLPSGALLTLDSDGTFTYDPNGQFEELAPGEEDTDSYDYTVEEPGGLSDSATVTITVTGVDDDPIAVDDTATVTEDDPATAIDVLANDTDVDGGPSSIQSVTQPANGTVTITNGGADLTYEPAAGYCNDGTPTDDFTYTLAPGGSTATVAVTVTCVDDDPVAVNDVATVAEDAAPTTIDVLANDTDADGGPIAIQSVTQPANGTVAITNGGADLTYQPAADYCNDGTPTDDFTYTLNGGSTATVSVTVTCVDDGPVAVDDAATVTEDSAPTTIDVLANDTDADGGPISIQSVTQPANGTVVITNGGADLTYQPDPDYCNDGTPTDDFTYSLAPDGSTATVSMTVTCVNDPPVAADDSFDFVGNTELRVDVGPAATPHALETTGSGFGALDNDADPVENDGLAVTSITVGLCTDNSGPTFDCTDPAVGTVHMSSDGSFSFEPAPGDPDASESFTYTVTDDGTPAASAVGTVTLNRFARIWYVKNDAPAGGDGTSVAPFDAITSANLSDDDSDGDLTDDLDSPGDYVFVYFGDGTTANMSSGLVLEDGQHLIGEHVGLSLPVDLNANGAPTVLVPPSPGNRPLLDDTVADGFHGVSARNVVPAEIAGMNLAGDVNAIHWTTTAAFSGNGAFRIRDNVIRSAGTEGVAIDLAGTGATQLAFHDNELAATGTALNIEETGTGTLTITAFDDNVVSGATGGSGIVVTGAIFDSVPGGAIDAVDGGTTAIGASGDGVGGAGMLLGSVRGDLHFTGNLSIFADGGTGLAVAGDGPMQLRVNSGGAATGIVEATGGPAVEAQDVTLDLRLSSLDSIGSASTGVSLTNVAGTFSAEAGSAIDNAAGTDFTIAGGTADVTYRGTISDDVGQLVSISNARGGTIAFEGAISDGDDGDGNGISLSNNTGATIRFSGGLVLSTGANTAFSATGGGIVTVCDENPCDGNATGVLLNKITTTTGTALNVANTTIGSTHIELRSVSSNGGSNPGIVLDTTGSSGGLKVKGAGGAGTGGTIQNKTVDGVSLRNTRDVSLSSMTITNNGGNGIFGDDVTNFQLIGSSVTSNGDTQNGSEANLRFNELLGTSAITNSTITGSSEDNIRLTPTSGVLTNLAISGSTISGCAAPVACNGVTILATGTADVTVTVTNSTFENNKASAFLTTTDDSANLTVDITTSAFRDNNVGVDVAHGGTGDLELNVSNNTEFLRHANDAIRVGTADSATNSTQVVGTIANNVIGDGTPDSGSRDAQGIDIDIRGDADAIIAITGNSISNTDIEGIHVQARLDNLDADAETGRLDLILRDNTINTPDDNSAFPLGALWGVLIEARNTTTVCLDIADNDSANVNLEDFRLRQRESSTFILERLSDGDATPNETLNDTALIEGFVAGENVAGSTADVTLVTGFREAADNFCRTP